MSQVVTATALVRVGDLTEGHRKRPGLDWRDGCALLFLLCAIAFLFWSAPKSGDFWWSDAPRHAMDGVFYHDLGRDHPFGHLAEYAQTYYLRYPALTILFYPPLFALVEAIFFGVFGVSHQTAQLTVSAFYLATATGGYCLCRRWFGVVFSLSAALLFIGLPEVALWGRQIMLELPACAFLLWSSWMLFQYLDTSRPPHLYLAAGLLMAGVYTKQTTVFMAPIFIVLLLNSGRQVLRARELWGSGALFAVGLLPLVLVTLKFGHVNFNSVQGGQWTEASLFSWASITFYLREIPNQAYWLTSVLALAWLALCLVRRRRPSSAEWFFVLWFAVAYIFFSSIALKEARHTVLMLFPMAVLALLGLQALLPPRIPATAKEWAGLLLALGAFGVTLGKAEVPYVGGYREAVIFVCANAPAKSVILFSGKRDGSFTFNMRSQDRTGLSVLRADKLLLRVAVKRELGVQELPVTPLELAEMLHRYGVSYVVHQQGFWTDLPAMRRFEAFLHTPQFRLVTTIPTSSNVNCEDRNIEIYQNLAPVNLTPEPIRLELPMVGISVQGVLGKSP